MIVGGIEVEEDDDGEVAGVIESGGRGRRRPADVASAAGGTAVQDCPYLNLLGEASWPVIAASDIIT